MHARLTFSWTVALWTLGLAGPELLGDSGTGVTLQALLRQDGEPLSGSVDLQGVLFDAAMDGQQVGATVQVNNVQAIDGLLNWVFDFGPQFDGRCLYLEVGVRNPHDPDDQAPFVTLQQRIAVTAAPEAIHAQAAAAAAALSTPATLAFGDDDRATLTLLANGSNPALALRAGDANSTQPTMQVQAATSGYVLELSQDGEFGKGLRFTLSHPNNANPAQEYTHHGTGSIHKVEMTNAGASAYCDLTTEGGGWTALFIGRNGRANAFDCFSEGRGRLSNVNFVDPDHDIDLCLTRYAGTGSIHRVELTNPNAGSYCDLTTEGGGWTSLFIGSNGTANAFDCFSEGRGRLSNVNFVNPNHDTDVNYHSYAGRGTISRFLYSNTSGLGALHFGDYAGAGDAYVCNYTNPNGTGSLCRYNYGGSGTGYLYDYSNPSSTADGWQYLYAGLGTAQRRSYANVAGSGALGRDEYAGSGTGWLWLYANPSSTATGKTYDYAGRGNAALWSYSNSGGSGQLFAGQYSGRSTAWLLQRTNPNATGSAMKIQNAGRGGAFEVQHSGPNDEPVYLIDVDGAGPQPAVEIRCDMTTDGSGYRMIYRGTPDGRAMDCESNTNGLGVTCTGGSGNAAYAATCTNGASAFSAACTDANNASPGLTLFYAGRGSCLDLDQDNPDAEACIDVDCAASFCLAARCARSGLSVDCAGDSSDSAYSARCTAGASAYRAACTDPFATSPAYQATCDGLQSAADFSCTSADNPRPVVRFHTVAREASSVAAEIDNPSGTGSAIEARSNGAGAAIAGFMTGTGAGLRVVRQNAGATEAAVQLQSDGSAATLQVDGRTELNGAVVLNGGVQDGNGSTGTTGQVLTADGNGSVTWQDAAGGGGVGPDPTFNSVTVATTTSTGRLSVGGADPTRALLNVREAQDERIQIAVDAAISREAKIVSMISQAMSLGQYDPDTDTYEPSLLLTEDGDAQTTGRLGVGIDRDTLELKARIDARQQQFDLLMMILDASQTAEANVAAPKGQRLQFGHFDADNQTFTAQASFSDADGTTLGRQLRIRNANPQISAALAVAEDAADNCSVVIDAGQSQSAKVAAVTGQRLQLGHYDPSTSAYTVQASFSQTDGMTLGSQLRIRNANPQISAAVAVAEDAADNCSVVIDAGQSQSARIAALTGQRLSFGRYDLGSQAYTQSVEITDEGAIQLLGPTTIGRDVNDSVVIRGTLSLASVDADNVTARTALIANGSVSLGDDSTDTIEIGNDENGNPVMLLTATATEIRGGAGRTVRLRTAAGQPPVVDGNATSTVVNGATTLRLTRGTSFDVLVADPSATTVSGAGLLRARVGSRDVVTADTGTTAMLGGGRLTLAYAAGTPFVLDADGTATRIGGGSGGRVDITASQQVNLAGAVVVVGGSATTSLAHVTGTGGSMGFSAPGGAISTSARTLSWTAEAGGAARAFGGGGGGGYWELNDSSARLLGGGGGAGFEADTCCAGVRGTAGGRVFIRVADTDLLTVDSSTTRIYGGGAGGGRVELYARTTDLTPLIRVDDTGTSVGGGGGGSVTLRVRDDEPPSVTLNTTGTRINGGPVGDVSIDASGEWSDLDAAGIVVVGDSDDDVRLGDDGAGNAQLQVNTSGTRIRDLWLAAGLRDNAGSSGAADQVLTADGLGGVRWLDVRGGGSDPDPQFQRVRLIDANGTVTTTLDGATGDAALNSASLAGSLTVVQNASLGGNLSVAGAVSAGGIDDGVSTGGAGQVLTANGAGGFLWQDPSGGGGGDPDPTFNTLTVTGGSSLQGGLNVGDANNPDVTVIPGSGVVVKTPLNAEASFNFVRNIVTDRLQISPEEDPISSPIIQATGNSTEPFIPAALIRNFAPGGTALGTTGNVNVEGDVCASGSVGNCSDARLKSNVTPLAGALEIVRRLRGVRFDWRRDDFPQRRFAAGAQVGFLAQELLTVLPEVVMKDKDGFYAVDYGKTTAVLAEAVKELDARLARHEAQVASQQHRIDAQQQQIAELTQGLARLEAAVTRAAGNDSGPAPAGK